MQNIKIQTINPHCPQHLQSCTKEY